MDVENPRRKLLHKPGREQAHVTGEADEIDFVVQECSYNFAVVLLASLTFRGNDKRIEPSLTGAFKTGSIGAVRNHDRNAGIGYPARRNAIRDSHKIGASSGKKDAEILHRTTLFTIWRRDRARARETRQAASLQD